MREVKQIINTKSTFLVFDAHHSSLAAAVSQRGAGLARWRDETELSADLVGAVLLASFGSGTASKHNIKTGSRVALTLLNY